MLYFKKGDYCEQNLDSLIYAANNILMIFILVGITVLTNVKYLNLSILYILMSGINIREKSPIKFKP